jgi:hypothetical protein
LRQKQNLNNIFCFLQNVELWFPRHQREVTKMTNPRLDKTKRDVEEYVRMCRDYRLDPQKILDVGLGQNDVFINAAN